MASARLRVATLGVAALIVAAAAWTIPSPEPAPASAATHLNEFNYTGGAQSFVVPGDVTCVTVDAFGAQGGLGENPDDRRAPGGRGGRATASVAVTPGETLMVYVGGQGGTPDAGFNGGGAGADAEEEAAGGGGGASDVRRAPYGLTDRLVVAGGGGGGGADARANSEGGDGGGANGADGNGSYSGTPTPGGGGGTQSGGGSAPTAFDPTATDGALGQGGQGGIGPSNDDGGGGGGGGYYGGGGGAGEDDDVPTDGGGGGGGGSGFGPADVTFETGVRAGNGYVTISSGCGVVIGTVDGETPAIETSVLELQLVTGLDCDISSASSPDCTYEWFRSAGQSDAGHVPSADTDPATPDERYNLDMNGVNDVGHRFFLRVTHTPSGTSLDSNVLAVGPRNMPGLVHPAASEEIRVQQPYFNLKNVTHDSHDPPNPAGSYEYDVQVSTDASFPDTAETREFTMPEQASNHDISYGQIGSSLLNGTYYWRARASIEDAPGRWSGHEQFTVGNTWSVDGHTWHSPTEGAAVLSGTHKEGYFHSGYLGTALHGGIDFAVCGVDIRAARSGIIERVGASGTNTVSLQHPALSPVRQTQYLHMSDLLTFPVGTYLNQGTRLGEADDVGIRGACHLHFDVANSDRSEYFDALDVLPSGSLTNTVDPTVASIRFRAVVDANVAHVTADAVGIGGEVYVIAGTNDPNPRPSGARGQFNLAPEEVEFLVNGASALVIDLGTGLTNAEHERDYYARRNARSRIPPTRVRGTYVGHYFLYYKWDTSTLPADAGPQTIEVTAEDHSGSSGSRTLTIGPEITTTSTSACTLTVRLENRNDNLEPLTGRTFRNDGDEYTVTVVPTGITAVLASSGTTTDTVEVAGGAGTDIQITLASNGGAVSSVELQVKSGILTDVGDAETIDVTGACL